MVNGIGGSGLERLDDQEQFDVCIIGSGPAGVVLGTELVRRGVKTLIVESGSSVLRWLVDTRLKSLAAYDFSGDTEYPLTMTKARALGGNSNFWTGRCERFHPSDFEKHPYTPCSNPWPIGFSDLDPFYERAERTLRVRGGPRSRFAPPRRAPLPLPPKPDVSYLKSLLLKVGVVADDSPTATPSRTFRFFKVQKEILPEFLKSRQGVLATGLTVTRLIPDSSRRIVAAEARTLNGEEKRFRARVFVVSCGGIETPRLLLLSRSEYFPNGIGNTYGRVGKGFNEHPSVNFYARIRHEWGTVRPTNKIVRTHQFYSDFRKEGLGSILPVIRQSWILPHHNMPLNVSKIPKNVMSVLGRLRRATLYIGVVIEMKICDSNRVTLSEKNVDMFGNPLAHLIFNYSEDDRELLNRSRHLVRTIYNRLGAVDIYEDQVSWSRHHQGTCRMGEDPKHSVVDSDLRVHECSNLYLCGSEVFVTGGAMQPCLTIVALAQRLVDHLASRLRQA